VLPGDSLSSIAKRYHVTPDRLRKLNNLKSDFLRLGQKLKVKSSMPAQTRSRSRYTVRRGDNLPRIARKHKMTVGSLKRLNPRLTTALKPGQSLWVIKDGPKPGAGLYQLEEGPGFEILERGRAWGTMLTVSRVAEVLSEHGIRHPEASPVLVGDISRERGGFLPPHRSHRRGRDVDIRYPLLVANKHYVPATKDTLDLKRTWSLIRAFIKTGDVMYVFVDTKLQRVLYEYAKGKGLSEEKLGELFQYPRGRRSMQGIIRHEPGHRTHFHVRFKGEPDGEGPTS